MIDEKNLVFSNLVKDNDYQGDLVALLHGNEDLVEIYRHAEYDIGVTNKRLVFFTTIQDPCVFSVFPLKNITAYSVTSTGPRKTISIKLKYPDVGTIELQFKAPTDTSTAESVITKIVL